MKTYVVTIHEAKMNLSGLLRRALDGGDVIIACDGKPVAGLVPIGNTKGKRQPGSLKGQLIVSPEFCEALPADELLTWE